MRAAAQRRDMYLTSISRPLTPDDLNKFDYIIGVLFHFRRPHCVISSLALLVKQWKIGLSRY